MNIKFKKPSWYIGRNGKGILTGIEVARDSDNIYLFPINTQGNSNAVVLAIPLEDAEKLIEALTKESVITNLQNALEILKPSSRTC